MASSRVPSTSFIASMLLVMRFIMTCCNCTRSPMTWGRSAANSARTNMECRVTSLRRRTIISRIISFISTDLHCGGPFWKSWRDPTDDFGRTLCVFHDTQRRRARLFEIRVVASEPAQAGFGVYPTQQAAANAGERALRRFLESEALTQEQ